MFRVPTSVGTLNACSIHVLHQRAVNLFSSRIASAVSLPLPVLRPNALDCNQACLRLAALPLLPSYVALRAVSHQLSSSRSASQPEMHPALAIPSRPEGQPRNSRRL